MKKIFSVGMVAITGIFFLSSCDKDLVVGDGPVVNEIRTVNNFRGVSYRIPGKIFFKIGPVYKVEVNAQANILAVLHTDVVNGILIIKFGNNTRVRDNADITVNIVAPSADYLNISGIGDMNAEGDLVTNSLDLSVSGLGNIVVQKATVNDKINAEISGSGNISIGAGIAVIEELRISGDGDMDLSNVLVQKGETHTSGSGDIKVNLSQSLEVFISGSGSVYYRGQPVITTHISGSGEVRPL